MSYTPEEEIARPDVEQTHCLANDGGRGANYMDCFDRLSAESRKVVRESKYNLCAACLDIYAMMAVGYVHPNVDYEHKLNHKHAPQFVRLAVRAMERGIETGLSPELFLDEMAEAERRFTDEMRYRDVMRYGPPDRVPQFGRQPSPPAIRPIRPIFDKEGDLIAPARSDLFERW